MRETGGRPNKTEQGKGKETETEGKGKGKETETEQGNRGLKPVFFYMYNNGKFNKEPTEILLIRGINIKTLISDNTLKRMILLPQLMLYFAICINMLVLFYFD